MYLGLLQENIGIQIDTNELFDNGALNVFSDYESLGKAIEEL